MVVKQYLTKFF